MNESEILVRLQQGDFSVFPAIVERLQDMVYNTALGIVQHEQDAEDITQEVFVTLYEKGHQFRGESKLSTWLYRVTIRKSLDVEKKKGRRKKGGFLKKIFGTTEEADIPHFEHPGVLLDKKEDAKYLFYAIKQLPEQQRIAFTLQKLEGLTNEEIADIMGNSKVAVESLQGRARANLKNILQQYYDKHF